jgi:hypothetical protein
MPSQGFHDRDVHDKLHMINLDSLFSRDIGANSKTMKGCGKEHHSLFMSPPLGINFIKEVKNNLHVH